MTANMIAKVLNLADAANVDVRALDGLTRLTIALQ